MIHVERIIGKVVASNPVVNFYKEIRQTKAENRPIYVLPIGIRE